MNFFSKKILLTMFMNMVVVYAFAQDFAVENAEGVTLYYNYINNGKELEVTKGSSLYNGDIVIPEEVTYKDKTLKVTSIGWWAFSMCPGLTSVTISNSVTSIGLGAFSKCSGLTSVSIPNSVTSIEIQAFDNCSGLTSVTIPNSVTSIGGSAFAHCTGLTSVTIENGVTSIGNAAFIGCYGLTSVSIPNSVTSIGDQAFDNCSGLTSVTIPNSVTSIGGWVFNNCSGLTSVTIPNSVTIIESGAFHDCSGLTSVIIPNSVTSIGESAFYKCSGLTSITIGSGVTSIGEYAFSGCDLPLVISLIENPFPLYYGTFNKSTFNNATLYVPVGTIDKYKSKEGWKSFHFIEEGTPTNINSVKEVQTTEVERYTLDGKRVSEPQRGLNIIKMNDGTTKKVLIK